MRIAICDDEQDCLDNINKVLQSCGSEIPNMSVTQFTNGYELIDYYKKHQGFDLIFLDVEMPEPNGLQVGGRIRDIDRDVIIVFLTGHRQYVFESLRIEVFDYLIKPAECEVVQRLLNRAYMKYREQHHIINLKWQSHTYALEVNSIVYIEGYNRHAMFFTIKDKYECVGKLDEYEAVLEPYGFLRCHQGFLVNMKYIKSIESDRLMTTTGIAVPMSVRKKQKCLRAFNNYLMRYQI